MKFHDFPDSRAEGSAGNGAGHCAGMVDSSATAMFTHLFFIQTIVSVATHMWIVISVSPKPRNNTNFMKIVKLRKTMDSQVNTSYIDPKYFVWILRYPKPVGIDANTSYIDPTTLRDRWGGPGGRGGGPGGPQIGFPKNHEIS